ncbi:RNA-directed DNA polymerase, eukaryota, Reverse transcriptase zinc-binding domain protein [Artemisia annua]|uniref:RNA-directed DNA polymerase, eukaryota, Reverse transcriptase zinc-binding domain protein n=1 Tax=Artemisia annua TaxID=35608 RepID=A0A2U1NY18_ARTAN|nr:RNA-directed DNA polymerase, eukaryota, Reverse transcriptase zinc-binding domain protein [Artemisia annua]
MGKFVYSCEGILNAFNPEETWCSQQVTRWCRIVPAKVNIMCWRAIQNRLPARSQLAAKGIDIPSVLCPSCLLAIEDVQHVIFKCDVAVEVWKKVAIWHDLHIPAIDDIPMLLDWVEASISDAKKRKVVGAIIYTTIWMLLRFRKSIVFKDPKMKKSLIDDNIFIHSFDWYMNTCACPEDDPRISTGTFGPVNNFLG